MVLCLLFTGWGVIVLRLCSLIVLIFAFLFVCFYMFVFVVCLADFVVLLCVWFSCVGLFGL